MQNIRRLVLTFLIWIAVFGGAGQVLRAQRPPHSSSGQSASGALQEVASRSSRQQQPEDQIEVESPLVSLDVLVTDEDGNVLSGLKKGNFRILDNGKPQVITTFGPTDDPITIVVLLEYSGVAYNYFAYKGAYWISGFLDHLGEKDWVALVTYDMKPTILVDFTRNRAEVRDALNTLYYPGFSEANLFDAVIDTLDKLDRVKGKKAVLIVTTGMNTFSTATLDDTISRIKKVAQQFFVLALPRVNSWQQKHAVARRSIICRPKTNCRHLLTSPED